MLEFTISTVQYVCHIGGKMACCRKSASGATQHFFARFGAANIKLRKSLVILSNVQADNL